MPEGIKMMLAATASMCVAKMGLEEPDLDEPPPPGPPDPEPPEPEGGAGGACYVATEREP